MQTYYSFSLYFYICIYYTQLTNHATHRGFTMMSTYLTVILYLTCLYLPQKTRSFPTDQILQSLLDLNTPLPFNNFIASHYISYICHSSCLILPHPASLPHLILWYSCSSYYLQASLYCTRELLLTPKLHFQSLRGLMLQSSVNTCFSNLSCALGISPCIPC